MMAIALVTVVIVSAVLGETEELGFFAIVAGVAVLAAGLVWLFDATWARIAGLVGTLAVTAVVFWLAFGVFQIFSPMEFIVGLLFLVGFLLALIWGVMAIVSGVRGRMGPTTAESVVRKWVFGAVGLLSIVSIVGFIFTRETVSDAEAAGATTVEMVGFEFEPGASSVTEGKLLIHNADPFAHDFTLDDLDIYVHVGPGSEVIVDLGAAASGTYEYFCSLHSDPATGEGMVGKITIEA